MEININDIGKDKVKPVVMTSVKISWEFYQKCKQHQIKFSEAMRVGISILLADKGLIDYDNKLNLMRNINQLHDNIQRLQQRLIEKEKRETAEK